MTDAHCHLWDLQDHLKDLETERRKTETAVAASAWNLEQFKYHESLAREALEDKAPCIFCCYGIHPQLSTVFLEKPVKLNFSLPEGLESLEMLGADGRLDAVGETGFDLYNEEYRAAEKIQDEIFSLHLETALKYSLPMIIHLRRAMHKIFLYTKELKKLPAVVFHSWPGVIAEGEALLRRGVNAYFSFGTVVLKNHKEAMNSAALFPADRILLETDAPYQPLRDKNFSSWSDLDSICQGIAALRKSAGSPCATKEELEEVTTANFFRVFAN